MSVGLLLVTHEHIGEQLLNAARAAMDSHMRSQSIAVSPQHTPEQIREAIAHALGQLDDGDGVLVLCDLFGATPCNCACLAQCDKVRVITGCNLAMVLKIFNYAHLDIESLARKALEGGKDHIFEAHP